FFTKLSQFITLNWLSACVPLPGVFPTVDISSCAERKSYLTEQFFFASSPVRSLCSVTRLRRALVIISD
ncbi:hypothetical protein DPL38_25355, partial [Escherichia coli]|nr:hypothetical protein [Escherichia coli]